MTREQMIDEAVRESRRRDSVGWWADSHTGNIYVLSSALRRIRDLFNNRATWRELKSFETR